MALPTERELENFHSALNKVRKKLFGRYTSQNYGFIDGSEKVLDLNIHVENFPDQTVRTISYGGFSFQLEKNGKFYEIKIQHSVRDEFSVWIGVLAVGQQQAFTVFASKAKFKDLDEEVLKLVSLIK